MAFGSTSGGFQDGHPRYLSLSGIAAAYLAAGCQLVPTKVVVSYVLSHKRRAL